MPIRSQTRAARDQIRTDQARKHRAIRSKTRTRIRETRARDDRPISSKVRVNLRDNPSPAFQDKKAEEALRAVLSRQEGSRKKPEVAA